MKKLFAVLLLVWCGVANSMDLMASVVSSDGGTAYDTNAAAVFAAMSPAPSTAYKSCINTSIVDLKAKGIWAALDRLWVLMGPDDIATSNNVLIDWVTSSHVLAKTGSLTWTKNVGIAGDGSSGYLHGDTNWNAFTNYQQDSASVAIGSNTAAQSTSAVVGYTSAYVISLGLRNTSDRAQITLNASSSDSLVSTDGSGFFIVDRNSSTTAAMWRNAVSLGAHNRTSTLPPAAPPSIFRSGSGYSAQQIYVVAIGGNINSGTKIADFGANMDALKSCIGALP